MISIHQVSLTYKQENTVTPALTEVSLQVKAGESLVLIGPSGCGKSSLLFLLAGLTRPTSGEVLIAGAALKQPRPETALILQDYGLFPWKTVWDNADLGLKIRGIPARRRTELVEPILESLGLAEHKHHFPAQLSGGQRQRVAVARALTLNPDLLLMDEPFSSLDALTRENLQDTILDIWNKGGLTLVTVTHSIEEAVFLGQKIAVFTPQPGRLKMIVDNPLAGDKGFRDKPEFYAKCAEVRRLLEVVSTC